MDSQHIFKFLKPKLRFHREEFWVIGFDTTKKIICADVLFLGSLRKCTVYPREVFRYGLIKNADQLVVAHTHTAHNALPSQEDINVTRHLIHLGGLLDLEVVDHLIISPKKYYSFFDEGLILNSQ